MSVQISQPKAGDSNVLKRSLKNLLMVLSEAYINSQLKSTCQAPQKPMMNSQHSTEMLVKEVTECDGDPNLQIFFRYLRKVPQTWIKFLVEDRIQSETTKLVINTSIVLTELYLDLLKNFQQDIKAARILHRQEEQPLGSFQQHYMSQTSLALIVEVFNNYAKRLAQCFMVGQQIISHNIELINQTIKKSQIMNSYMLFGMLKQAATYTSNIITQNISSKFPFFSKQKCNQFCKYIQKNYELIQLEYLEAGNNFIYSKKQMAEYIRQENQIWLTFLKSDEILSLKKIQNSKGEAGILIVKKSSTKINSHSKEKQNQKKQKSQKSQKKMKEEQKKKKEQDDNKLILKIQKDNQIKVINARTCQESWRIFESKGTFQQIYENLQKEIETSGRNAKQYVSYGVATCEFATIGGSLGKCLADINQYQSANQFFMDLSKTAAIYSTISYAMASIPILSYFIIAGGFTYSFYMACSNEATSSFKKFDQMKNFTISVLGSVGTTLGGIMLGQAIIPVPFFGAFVGGVVGGFFGTKGMRKINQFLAKSDFRDIIIYMKHKLIADSYWECSDHLLQRIGLNQQYFNNHTAGDKKSRDTWMTAICFCLVTFYESKRYIEFNKLKMNEQKGKERQQEKQEIKQEEELFVNEFNLVGIIDFLTEREFTIVEHVEELANFISHLV